MQVTIYHNPKCAKSRATLELLRARRIEPTVIEYLKTPPTRSQLDTLLKQLGMEPRALLRTRAFDTLLGNRLSSFFCEICCFCHTPISIPEVVANHCV